MTGADDMAAERGGPNRGTPDRVTSVNDHDADADVLSRLGELALVQIDTLVAGAPGPVAAALVSAYIDDIRHTLGLVEARLCELTAEAGPSPLTAVLRHMPGTHALPDVVERLDVLGRGMRARARDFRTQARLCEASAPLFSRLIAAERYLAQMNPMNGTNV